MVCSISKGVSPYLINLNHVFAFIWIEKTLFEFFCAGTSFKVSKAIRSYTCLDKLMCFEPFLDKSWTCDNTRTYGNSWQLGSNAADAICLSSEMKCDSWSFHMDKHSNRIVFSISCSAVVAICWMWHQQLCFGLVKWRPQNHTTQNLAGVGRSVKTSITAWRLSNMWRNIFFRRASRHVWPVTKCMKSAVPVSLVLLKNMASYRAHLFEFIWLQTKGLSAASVYGRPRTLPGTKLALLQ